MPIDPTVQRLLDTYTITPEKLGVPLKKAAARSRCSSRTGRVSLEDLDEVARRLGVSQKEAVEKIRPAGAIYFMLDEKDVQRILSFDETMIGSDGLPHDAKPHPRLWGTFPRVLGHYARDLKLFSLETAVYKMTGFPAKRFGLSGRGVLQAGAQADITLFDPNTIIDAADFKNGSAPAKGVHTVIVNGAPVWAGGKSTGILSGRLLTRG